MSVFKDEKTNKWYAMVRFTDWQGQRKQKCKRGFATRRDALEWGKGLPDADDLGFGYVL